MGNKLKLPVWLHPRYQGVEERHDPLQLYPRLQMRESDHGASAGLQPFDQQSSLQRNSNDIGTSRIEEDLDSAIDKAFVGMIVSRSVPSH